MRRLLTPGSEVTVLYLAAREQAVVERVEEGGRVVIVRTDEDRLLRFTLMASAHYITDDHSARIAF